MTGGYEDVLKRVKSLEEQVEIIKRTGEKLDTALREIHEYDKENENHEGFHDLKMAA